MKWIMKRNTFHVCLYTIMGVVVFLILNFIGMTFFYDEDVPDVDGKYHGFTKEELDIGSPELYFQYNKIYYNATKQTPIIEDGVIRFEDVDEPTPDVGRR